MKNTCLYLDYFRNDTGPQTGVCIAMHSEEAAGGRFSVLIIMNGIHPAAGHYPLDS